MKHENDFYYFLSFITFYTILLIWYTYFTTNYKAPAMPAFSERPLDEHTFVDFFFQVVMAFPFGIINWFNGGELNVIFYFLGAVFYSFLFYQIYHKKLSNLLHMMVLLNIMAVIFLFAFFLENPLVISETGT